MGLSGSERRGKGEVEKGGVQGRLDIINSPKSFLGLRVRNVLFKWP